MIIKPFSRLLIANRGEIALRIIRAAKSLNLTTLAIYVKSEENALHVQKADEARNIGTSYLDIPAIIEAALAMKAEAIHPGYGFLSENAAFATACLEAGLVFVGPSPALIAAMGDKAEAKKQMHKAGVPILEGYEGDDILKAGKRLGVPLMVKAQAGGGGRGMRLVTEISALPLALESAQQEAKAAFGDGRVMLERAIINPRHIEIQVLADMHGHAIHLGERDCSLQRRHQKLIEEAPSSALTPTLRQKMGDIAVHACKEMGYVGAGTFEFLLDEKGDFAFMEMNTRLQVEHPVTEAITGVDIVQWQLHIAQGKPLTISQEDITFKGHAIEARLCAENPAQNFMPQAGDVVWLPPQKARVETGLKACDHISPSFDSMVAKIITHGASREEARLNMLNALEEMALMGVASNQHFLSASLNHPDFISGNVTTAFLAHNPQLCDNPPIPQDLWAIAALLLATPFKPHRLAAPFPLPLILAAEGTREHIALSYEKNHIKIGLKEAELALKILDLSPNKARISFNSHEHFLFYNLRGNHLSLVYQGHAFTFQDVSLEPQVKAKSTSSANNVRALMTGKVVAVHVQEGQEVAEGTPLITLEAMKMQHHHVAPRAGIIKKLNTSLHAQVASGSVLAELVE